MKKPYIVVAVLAGLANIIIAAVALLALLPMDGPLTKANSTW